MAASRSGSRARDHGSNLRSSRRDRSRGYQTFRSTAWCACWRRPFLPLRTASTHHQQVAVAIRSLMLESGHQQQPTMSASHQQHDGIVCANRPALQCVQATALPSHCVCRQSATPLASSTGTESQAPMPMQGCSGSHNVLCRSHPCGRAAIQDLRECRSGMMAHSTHRERCLQQTHHCHP